MIKLEEALVVAEVALKTARTRQLNPMTVAVLDARGCLVALQMEDGSSLLREDIAKAKGLSALALGMGTRALVGRAKHHPAFFVGLSGLSGGNMIPVPGGVLIRSPHDAAIVGAVGVSGDLPDHDEACAIAGIEATAYSWDAGADLS
ncbi:heme-binding protein [Xanthobacter sp. KR7-225]|uniref:GlcG/HbpS family heme-binding protein n=1 Tax=Xanthobacter sp. KR7-225 TaxID=3156613 RepID=UPI0032B595C9